MKKHTLKFVSNEPRTGSPHQTVIFDPGESFHLPVIDDYYIDTTNTKQRITSRTFYYDPDNGNVVITLGYIKG